jgi:flagellar protein FliL
MAEVAEAKDVRTGGGKGLVAGILAALVLGAAGFGAVWTGVVDPRALIGGGEPTPPAVAALEDIGFVPLEPIIVAMPETGAGRHLRFVGQLEVVPDHAAEVVSLMPRITDALNTYLRALEARDLQQPAATVWLRAQMLRRIQLVTGEGRVRDLLITEFVFN